MLMLGAGLATAGLTFLAWFAIRTHERNLDRVCISLERQARYGHPVANVDRVLKAAAPPPVVPSFRSMFLKQR
jgi:hypothetical protein